ncbi:FAD-binding protein [Phytopseudomonas daroniae]|uniref:FAD-binding protein n=1 Tax=Phytopseudomonas daroniae TaxID=2487519 RepID=UPI0010385368|nr:FAD-binding protein [Pseudomonas daroniae]TBU76346.1 L-aspartate oxidase [Pseudomonas daroniae]
MTTQQHEVSTDVLIIGSGAAALRTALEASDGGADVLIAIKGEFRRSGATFHSVAEVGAFNVPDGAGDALDDPQVFLDDILRAAQGMADPRLAKILADEAQSALHYLERYGVHFEREEDRYLVFRACFSSRPRSHVIQDHFKPIVKALGSEASRRGIRVMDRLMVTDLLVQDGECVGAHALDQEGRAVLIRAKSTILTTGGASQLFEKNLYPSDITGDGYAMAYRAGAQLVNMEFMQAGVSVIAPFVNLFGNYLWDARPNLTDRDGNPFVEDYLPEGLTLDAVLNEKERHFPFSSSDISRYIEISIQKAINAGRGTDQGGVYMDFIGRDLGPVLADGTRSISRMWPLTYKWYQEKGIDLYRDKVQITCSAHAINGGLRIDENAESTLPGLFAAGEVAAGPHGADRLGGNMSVTCMVFGARAGRAAAARACSREHPPLAAEHAGRLAPEKRFAGQGSHALGDIRQRLQKAANRHLLILRDRQGLQGFQQLCLALRQTLRQDTRIDSPADWVAALETDNLLDVGELMARAALAREESRGSHYREDHPVAAARFEHSFVLSKHSLTGLEAARLGND